jgi:OmpA-OmpF porin, OOP family
MKIPLRWMIDAPNAVDQYRCAKSRNPILRVPGNEFGVLISLYDSESEPDHFNVTYPADLAISAIAVSPTNPWTEVEFILNVCSDCAAFLSDVAPKTPADAVLASRPAVSPPSRTGRNGESKSRELEMVLRKRMPLAGLTLVLSAATAAPALAQTGFYVGATAGESLYHESRSEADATVFDAFDSSGLTVVSGSSHIDKSDLAFGGLVGYRFIPGFAVEAGYLDLGKLEYKFSGTVSGFVPRGPSLFLHPATANLTAKAKGPTLAALGILPLSPSWDVYGRLGLIFSKVTLTADITVETLPGSDSESANSVDTFVGIGTAWHVGNNVALRAEYTRLPNVGDKDKTGETNIDLFSLTLTYSFR